MESSSITSSAAEVTNQMASRNVERGRWMFGGILHILAHDAFTQQSSVCCVCVCLSKWVRERLKEVAKIKD